MLLRWALLLCVSPRRLLLRLGADNVTGARLDLPDAPRFGLEGSRLVAEFPAGEVLKLCPQVRQLFADLAQDLRIGGGRREAFGGTGGFIAGVEGVDFGGVLATLSVEKRLGSVAVVSRAGDQQETEDCGP